MVHPPLFSTYSIDKGENIMENALIQLFSLPLEIGLFIILIAFAAEYTDSTLGMGYGTSLTPILLLLGFSPLEVVPAVLLSELVTGLLIVVVGLFILLRKPSSSGFSWRKITLLG